MDWMGLKGVADQIGLGKDALHIYAAVAIHVAAGAALRRPLSSWIPWGCVLAAEILNEFLDVWFGEETHVQQWQMAGAKHDLINTMVLPTALLLLCRYAPQLFQPQRRVAPPDSSNKAES